MGSLNFGSQTFGAVGSAFSGGASSAVSHAGEQTRSAASSVEKASGNVRTMVQRTEQNESDIAKSMDNIRGGQHGTGPRTAPGSTRPAGPPPPIAPKPAGYTGKPIQSSNPAGTRPSGPPPIGPKPAGYTGKPIQSTAPGSTTPSSSTSRPNNVPPPVPPRPNRPTAPGSTTPSSAHTPPQPAPAPAPAPHGQTAPANKPSWMQTDANGWPVQPPGRQNPKLFTEQNNVNPYTGQQEQYHSYVDANGNRMVTVYRFAQQGEPKYWESPLRTNSGGNFGEHNAGDTAHMAHEQTHNGRKSDSADQIPFVSVTTGHQQLHSQGEGWVQDLLGDKNNRMGTFQVPASSLFRPNVPSGVTRREQEWLYYDGNVPLKDNPHTFQDNPYA